MASAAYTMLGQLWSGPRSSNYGILCSLQQSWLFPTTALDLFQKTHFLVRACHSVLGKQALLVLLLFQLKCRCCQGSQGDVITQDSAKHCSLLHQLDKERRHLSFSFPVSLVPVSQPRPHSIVCCHVYGALENTTRASPAHSFTCALQRETVHLGCLDLTNTHLRDICSPESLNCRNTSHHLLGLRYEVVGRERTRRTFDTLAPPTLIISPGMMPLTSLERRKVKDRSRQHQDSMIAKFSLWLTNHVLAAQQGERSRGVLSATSCWSPSLRQRTTSDHHLFL